jgi:LCP family protein required for cell wall assembly
MPKSLTVIGARVLPFPGSTQRHHGGSPGAGGPPPPSPEPGDGRRPDRPTRPQLTPQPPDVLVRRAVSLLLLTLVLPGSAQWVAGDRRVAKVALGAVAGCLAAALLLALTAVVDLGAVLGLVADSTLLRVLAVLVLGAGLGEAMLLADAWRLGRPAVLPRRARPLIAAGTAIAVVLVTGVAVAGARRAWAGAGLLDDVFHGGAASGAVDGRYTVLLLGGDAGPDRLGTRPDSVTVASIDATTGRTVLFSLPRNLEDVPFAPGSPAARALPSGWSCGDSCLLNAIYTWGTQHAELFPGARDPGAEAMKEAVSGVTGLQVNYYVLIDLAGFRQLIDAMGGITVTVRQPVPIGGGTSAVKGYIQPGQHHLDGYHALWFARSRHGASDYARMQRQRCVMNAMLHQLDPTSVLSRFEDIAAAGGKVVSTDLPAGELGRFVGLAAGARSQPLTSVQFVPPLVDPAHPDMAAVRARVAETLRTGAPPPTSGTPTAAANAQPPAASAPAGGSGGSSGSAANGGSSGSAANGGDAGTPATSDVEAVCSTG